MKAGRAQPLTQACSCRGLVQGLIQLQKICVSHVVLLCCCIMVMLHSLSSTPVCLELPPPPPLLLFTLNLPCKLADAADALSGMVSTDFFLPSHLLPLGVSLFCSVFLLPPINLNRSMPLKKKEMYIVIAIRGMALAASRKQGNKQSVVILTSAIRKAGDFVCHIAEQMKSKQKQPKLCRRRSNSMLAISERTMSTGTNLQGTWCRAEAWGSELDTWERRLRGIRMHSTLSQEVRAGQSLASILCSPNVEEALSWLFILVTT
jgi:hypothetical protein